jgi:hypothetical protein
MYVDTFAPQLLHIPLYGGNITAKEEGEIGVFQALGVIQGESEELYLALEVGLELEHGLASILSDEWAERKVLRVCSKQ